MFHPRVKCDTFLVYFVFGCVVRWGLVGKGVVLAFSSHLLSCTKNTKGKGPQLAHYNSGWGISLGLTVWYHRVGGEG